MSTDPSPVPPPVAGSAHAECSVTPRAGEVRGGSRRAKESAQAVRDAFILTAALVIVGLLAVTGLFRSSASAIEGELRDDLIRIASAAASLVDGDLHEQITSPSHMDAANYSRVIAPLRRLHAGTPGVKYVYTAVQRDGGIRFVLDTAKSGDHDGDGRDDRAYVGELYHDAEPEIRRALGEPGIPGVASASPRPYRDQWGVFVTGYAPIYNSAGRQVGVVGVDVEAGVHLARVAEARRTVLMGIAPAMLGAALLGIGLFASRRRALAAARASRDSGVALAASEARARALIEGSDIVLWEYVPSRGVFTYVSPQAERFGYPLSDWFRPGFWEDHLHPEDRAAAISHCAAETRIGRNHRLHYRMIKPDGAAVWIDDVVSVSRDHNGDVILRGVFIDITEGKEAERKLRELYTRLQKIASQVPGLVYQYKLHPDGSACFPYASDGIRDTFGLEPADVRVDSEKAFDVIHPDDVQSVRRSIHESAANLTPWRMEFRVRPRDAAEVRWLLGNSVPQREPDGSTLWHGFITDITERKEAEEFLLAANKRFDLARRSVRIGVWDWNHKTGELEWDEGMYDLYDVDERTLRARRDSWSRRVHPDDITRVDEDVRRCIDTGCDFDNRFRVVHRDGTVLWLAAHGVVIRDAAGEIVRLVGLNIDISREVSAHEAVSRARDQAQAANLAKSQFLANMSHEIRTPLTAILGYADLLRDERDAAAVPPHRLELIDTIRHAGRHLLDIINDILDLSKIEAGKMSVERTEISLGGVVSEVEMLVRPRALAKGIALDVRLDTPVPDRIIGDPTRLRQILMNLAGNAIKFTEAGSVTIRIAAGRRLRIDVEDTGVGLTPDQAAGLFQAFTQADPTVTRRHGGTGLGLVICRRLAHLMGGDVSLLRTDPGAGSVFRLDLPLERAEGAVDQSSIEPFRPAQRHAPTPAPSVVGRVLIVEDGPENQRLIAFYLRRAGAEVQVADHGGAALSIFETAADAGSPFDLIITDVQMPVMDGCTFARTLRARGHAVPIIALTAHAMAEDRDRCLASGCNGYATKPIDAVALLELAAGLIRAQPAAF